ncbi:MAG: NUDIX domain-containing protein [Betaproteobacteria bacterium]
MAEAPQRSDDQLTETTLSSETVYQGSFLRVKRDRVVLPDGAEAAREYIVHPGAAVMVPLFDDGSVLIERQFRYPLRQVFVEVPAGKRDHGEQFIETAQRELLEETGYVAREWAYLTRLHPAIGFADEVLEIYLCRGLEYRGRQLDDGEFLELEAVSVDWLMDAIRAGTLTDVKTQIVAFWLDRLRSGAWPWPEFRPASA